MVYDSLKKCNNLSVRRKEEIPREFRYTYNRRIMPIVIEANPGFVIARNASDVNNSGGVPLNCPFCCEFMDSVMGYYAFRWNARLRQ